MVRHGLSTQRQGQAKMGGSVQRHGEERHHKAKAWRRIPSDCPARHSNGTVQLRRAGKGGAWAKRGFGRGARQRQIWAEHIAALRSKGGAKKGSSKLSQAKAKHNSETRNNAAATAEHGTAGAKRVNAHKRQAMAQRHHETHRKGEAGPSPESHGEAKARHVNSPTSVALHGQS